MTAGSVPGSRRTVSSSIIPGRPVAAWRSARSTKSTAKLLGAGSSSKRSGVTWRYSGLATVPATRSGSGWPSTVGVMVSPGRMPRRSAKCRSTSTSPGSRSSRPSMTSTSLTEGSRAAPMSRARTRSPPSTGMPVSTTSRPAASAIPGRAATSVTRESGLGWRSNQTSAKPSSSKVRASEAPRSRYEPTAATKAVTPRARTAMSARVWARAPRSSRRVLRVSRSTLTTTTRPAPSACACGCRARPARRAGAGPGRPSAQWPSCG